METKNRDRSQIKETEKNPEVYSLLWESFMLSQGKPALQELIFQWLSYTRTLPKNIPQELPEDLYFNLGTPTDHPDAGTAKFDESQKEIIYSLGEKLTEAFTNSEVQMVVDLMEGKILNHNQLRHIQGILEKVLKNKTLSSVQRNAVDQLRGDAKRKEEIIKIWHLLNKAKESPGSLFGHADEIEFLEKILLEIIKRDMNFIKTKEGRERTGVSKKPDDDKDSFASYTRKYILRKEKEVRTPGLKKLVDLLHQFAHSSNRGIMVENALEDLQDLWETRHNDTQF